MKQIHRMTSELIIRAARVDERGELEALQRRASLVWKEYREALLSHPEAVEVPVEQIRESRVHVAERDGKILGFMVILPRIDAAADLDGLFVEPGAWRGGIGTRLVREAERLASGQGAAFLHVIASPQAEGFYAVRGFDLVGNEQTRFGMGLSMRKNLAAA